LRKSIHKLTEHFRVIRRVHPGTPDVPKTDPTWIEIKEELDMLKNPEQKRYKPVSIYNYVTDKNKKCEVRHLLFEIDTDNEEKSKVKIKYKNTTLNSAREARVCGV